jgi:Domain of unknown function (DUF4112)
MAYGTGTGTGTAAPLVAPELEQRLARLRRVAELLDSAVGIPGTRIRFGLDSIAGLIPGIGDGAAAAVGLWFVWEAAQLGVPKPKLARMLANLGIDFTVGSVPLLGDVFDVVWKANRRNYRIITEHFDPR